ncbi:MAG: hypothetical protein IPI58_09325 [Alphaproteobacteria bacterium]|nr:MAG: hypothetical protein IPI58_09325 [Alphaproteobacteria bacterium]
MPYVIRDSAGSITKITARQFPGCDVLAPDSDELVTFLKSKGIETNSVLTAIAELRRTDNEMSRAVEDVITALLKRNVLKMSDLPKAVQDRIALRVRLRLQIQEAYDRASVQRRICVSIGDDLPSKDDVPRASSSE